MTVRGCFLTLALACSALGDEAAALRLVTHWQFADQTDVHNELVIKTERLLMASDAPQAVQANVVDCRDLLAGTGVVFVVEGPTTQSRWSGDPDFTISGRGFVVHSNGFPVAALPYSGGDVGRIRAIRAHSRRQHPYHPKRNGLMLSNTWGDRAFSPIAGFLYAYLAAPVAGGREFSVRISVETKGHQGR